MANLGAVGKNFDKVPYNLSGPYAYWRNPYDHAQKVVRNESYCGPLMYRLGFANGRTPADDVSVIVAAFGDRGGYVYTS